MLRAEPGAAQQEREVHLSIREASLGVRLVAVVARWAVVVALRWRLGQGEPHLACSGPNSAHVNQQDGLRTVRASRFVSALRLSSRMPGSCSRWRMSCPGTGTWWPASSSLRGFRRCWTRWRQGPGCPGSPARPLLPSRPLRHPRAPPARDPWSTSSRSARGHSRWCWFAGFSRADRRPATQALEGVLVTAAKLVGVVVAGVGDVVADAALKVLDELDKALGQSVGARSPPVPSLLSQLLTVSCCGMCTPAGGRRPPAAGAAGRAERRG